MPYVLFTLFPLFVSLLLAAIGTLVFAHTIAGRVTYFALATAVVLGLHALITALHKVLGQLNPVPQAIYGIPPSAEPPSDFELFLSLFTTERVVVLAVAIVLAVPALVLLKHAMSRSGAA